ncbi:TonB-dependent receptor [Parapedobacter pyrenivorans]|nr:TonB-dependent receptor [Parapedobacter pyrenivorans]
MKLISLFLAIACLHVSAESLSQTVTLNVKEQPITKVFAAIEAQTGYLIIYNDQYVKPNLLVSLNVKNQPLEVVLNQVLTPRSLVYKIKDKTIAVRGSTRNKENLPIQHQQVISGRVTDEQGAALEGVTVRVKGTSTATTTNANGDYSIHIPGAGAKLTYTILGFEAVELDVANQPSINVSLKATVSNLDEAVVVGYGTMNKREIVGAVGVVPVEDMKRAPVVSFDQALAGRVAGVEVRADDGQPGAPINIIVRGGNSITQSNSPLYVVDDFPLEDNENNSINPADIASIVILKDAAATAIYGSRGANGVVLITTKRGQEGRAKIAYDLTSGFQSNTKRIELLSPYEFVKLQLEINNESATLNYLSDGKTLEDYRNQQPIDWYGKIFQNSNMTTHNLSASGGTAKSKYAVSGSYANQDGIILNSGFKRYQGRVAFDHQLTEKLKLGLTLNYADYNTYGTVVNNIDQSGVSGPYMYSVWSYRPIEIPGQLIDFEDELFDPNTETGGGFNDRRVNPLIQAQNEVRRRNTSNLFTSTFLEYTILKGLKVKVTGGFSKNLSQDIAFNNSKTRTGSPLYPLSLGVNGKNVNFENLNYVNENTITYTRSFDQHKLNVVAGFSQQRHSTSSSGIEAQQLPNEALGISGLDQGVARNIIATSSANRLQSVFGRVIYDYKSKYSIQGILRGDGSSKFAAGNQWAYFPSLGVKYALIEEGFMTRMPFISDAVLRASFGYSGNNRVSDFAYLTSIGFPLGNAYSFGHTTPVYGAAATGIGNPDLRWETTKSVDVGVELGFLDNRISLIADYYNKRTYDLLLNAQIPGTSGFTTAFKNIGAVQNRGFEFTLNTININSKSFNWTSSFNISFNRNKILSLTEGQESIVSTSGGPFGGVPKYLAKVGYPVALFYGAIYDGVYQYEDFYQTANGSYVLKDELPANGTTRSGIAPGHARYRDLNNDGNVNTDDFTVIGNPNADFVGGFNNNFTFRGFDLGVFLRFSYGNDVLNANRIIFEGQDNFTVNTNMYATYADRWSPDNVNSTIPTRAGRGPQYWSTRIVEDASMLRLGVVSLGYTYTGRLMSRLKMSSVRFSFAANNLYTWTNYSGLDPEVAVRSTNLTPAMDYSAYPRARTMVFGLNVNF